MKIVQHRLKHRDNNHSKNKIVVAIILNLMIVLLQIIYGFLSNSVSLLTDAIHNLQDVVSLLVALIAIILINRLPTMEMTYGFLRSEALAGFVNSLLLTVVIFVIITLAIKRLILQEEVEGLYVVLLGLIGFIANFISAKLLLPHSHEEESQEDLNIKAAYLHLLSDAGISLGVFLGGILIYFYKLYWVDPVFAIIFSSYILKENFSILKKSYKILMEAVPEHLNLEELLKHIHTEFSQVKEIHDIHVWSLSSKDVYLSAHVVLEEDKFKDYNEILKKLELFFRSKGINHVTIQVETENFNCDIYH